VSVPGSLPYYELELALGGQESMADVFLFLLFLEGPLPQEPYCTVIYSDPTKFTKIIKLK
jgi:hypothetical protein